MRKTFRVIASQAADAVRKKLVGKVPQWDVPGLRIPDSLAVEQCSSFSTSSWKAGLAKSLIPSAKAVADITGGIGVDTWAFSRQFEKTLYNEMDPSRFSCSRDNFKLLGCTGVSCYNHEVSIENGAFWRILEDFAPDMIYLDPARRDSTGKKLFLLEDCSPDVLGILNRLLSIAGIVLVKVSPMADLTMLSKRFGQNLQAQYVIEARGECKEVLCVISREAGIGPYSLSAVSNQKCLTLGQGEVVLCKESDIAPGKVLFVPGPSLCKAGRFGYLCAEYGLTMVGRDSHCFICPSETITDDLAGFGKPYRIDRVFPFSSSSIKEVGKKYPFCEVTARGLPVRSEELRKKMGSKPGDNYHLFALSSDSQRIIIATEKIW